MYGNIEALKASPKCQEKFPAECDGTQNFFRYRDRYFFSGTGTGTFSGTKFFRYRYRNITLCLSLIDPTTMSPFPVSLHFLPLTSGPF